MRILRCLDCSVNTLHAELYNRAGIFECTICYQLREDDMATKNANAKTEKALGKFIAAVVLLTFGRRGREDGKIDRVGEPWTIDEACDVVDKLAKRYDPGASEAAIRDQVTETEESFL